ncbi:MAG: hypothetical protein K2F63_04340, partial [Muribaculaceae bacterium]|nr:hypothetical protein [Muribaculaceae bacterium]
MKPDQFSIEESFVRTCKSILGAMAPGRKISMRQILEKALAERPEGHYVEFSTALRALYLVRSRGEDAVFKRDMIRERWSELNAQVNDVMRRRPAYSFPRALAYALTYRRPSRYYIPERTARALLRRA